MPVKEKELRSFVNDAFGVVIKGVTDSPFKLLFVFKSDALKNKLCAKRIVIPFLT